jgi:D-threo-aldose 1-dehydrogenase
MHSADNIDIYYRWSSDSGVLANPVAGATYNYLPASDEIIARAAKIGAFLKERGGASYCRSSAIPVASPSRNIGPHGTSHCS